jgi:hypothetical protein
VTNGVQAKLEHNQYVATPADIKALTAEQMNAIGTSNRGRTTYLRAVIATTQDTLGITPKARSQGQPVKLTKEVKSAQLEALEATHDKFYKAVIAAIEENPVEEENGKATTSKAAVTRRATFARTAMSTIRSWVKHGHDLSTLFPAKVTKHAITLPTGQRRQRKPSAKRLVTAVQSQVKELIVTLLALSEVDKAKAISEEQTVIGQLSEQLIELGVVATRDAGVALAEGRPLKLGSGRGTQIFMPTASQVIRSQARPS